MLTCESSSSGQKKGKGICTLAWHNIKLQNTFQNSIETFSIRMGSYILNNISQITTESFKHVTICRI